MAADNEESMKWKEFFEPPTQKKEEKKMTSNDRYIISKVVDTAIDYVFVVTLFSAAISANVWLWQYILSALK